MSMLDLAASVQRSNVDVIGVVVFKSCVDVDRDRLSGQCQIVLAGLVNLSAGGVAQTMWCGTFDEKELWTSHC